MPAKLDRCIERVKKQVRKEHPEWSDDRVNDYAYGACVKATGLHPSDDSEVTTLAFEEANSDQSFKWSSKIVTHESFDSALATMKRPEVTAIYGLQEAQLDILNETGLDVKENDTHFFIVGEAIHPVTTSNMHTYLAEELEAAASTLAGCPIMVDHGKGSLDNAGKVLVSAWERRAGLDSTVSYVARVRKSHPVAEAVKVGDIDTVSVSAFAEKIECSICGEDMRYCPHHIGQTYEYDGEDTVATALGRGLEFRELSITPFPADPRASAWVKNDSMFSAIAMLVESSEYKAQPQKVGVITNMSEDKSEELALAEENRKLQAEKEQLQKETEEARQMVEAFQKREKAALVDRAFELEVKANLSRSEDEKVRKTELNALSVEVLKSKIEDMKRFSSVLELSEPKSKAVVAEAPEEKKEEEKSPLTYTREQVKAGLRVALGNLRTSEKAKVVTRQMALDSQNPNSSEYRALLKGNMEKILGRNE
jgi:hypothetical protein